MESSYEDIPRCDDPKFDKKNKYLVSLNNTPSSVRLHQLSSMKQIDETYS